MNDIVVSVMCTAYNHEKYIRKCLEGFIMQKAMFDFEVIVHDDASTDKTAEIIREYEKKYPKIIKAVYQTENQYSKGIKIGATWMLPHAQGKYIALCEGDDFWEDPYKLQKQVDEMENHPECLMAVARVRVVNDSGDSLYKFIPPVAGESRIIASDEMVRLALGLYPFQTSSYMIRSTEYKKFQYIPPKFKTLCPVGDMTMLLYFGSLAPVIYNSDVLSDYRQCDSGSWSVRFRESSEMRCNHYRSLIEVYREFNKFSNEKYSDILDDAVIYSEYCLNLELKNYRTLLKRRYRRVLSKESPKTIVYFILKSVFSCDNASN